MNLSSDPSFRRIFEQSSTGRTAAGRYLHGGACGCVAFSRGARLEFPQCTDLKVAFFIICTSQSSPVHPSSIDSSKAQWHQEKDVKGIDCLEVDVLLISGRLRERFYFF